MKRENLNSRHFKNELRRNKRKRESQDLIYMWWHYTLYIYFTKLEELFERGGWWH